MLPSSSNQSPNAQFLGKDRMRAKTLILKVRLQSLSRYLVRAMAAELLNFFWWDSSLRGFGFEFRPFGRSIRILRNSHRIGLNWDWKFRSWSCFTVAKSTKRSNGQREQLGWRWFGVIERWGNSRVAIVGYESRNFNSSWDCTRVHVSSTLKIRNSRIKFFVSLFKFLILNWSWLCAAIL